MAGLSHTDDYYETPAKILELIREIAGRIDVDLCATPKNAKAVMFLDEERDALRTAADYGFMGSVIFCNPPRSKNMAFVELCLGLWWDGNDVFVLMCWQDFGYKYGQKIWRHVIGGDFDVYNLGKVRFYKDNKPSKFVSRNTYLLCHMKARLPVDVSAE